MAPRLGFIIVAQMDVAANEMRRERGVKTWSLRMNDEHGESTRRV